jgi:THAP4-like, heme-binding beta-barrel domain
VIDVHRLPPPFLGSRTRRLARAALGLSLVCLLSVTDGRAQQPTAPDPFAPVAFMIGRWEGSSEGQPGKANVRREYSRALNGRFVRVWNRSEYPVQNKNPKGEIHEDEGFFSFDRARKRLVLRQFHVEGFVNQYVQDSESSSQKLVFTTESIENIPAGWRARETYVVHGPDEFEEIFELAEAGSPFELYSRARLKRVR